MRQEIAANTSPPANCSPSPSRIAIRANSGLGDAIYLQSVCRWFVEQGHLVEACSAWPDVFRPLGDRVVVSPFRRHPVDRLAAYTLRKANKSTTQFQDCCIQAGAPRDTDLRLDWKIVDAELVATMRGYAPYAVVVLPRAPFNRRDGFGMELLPDCRVIQRAIDMIRECGLSIVQVGSGKPLFRFSGIDLDISGRTSVAQLIDVSAAAHLAVGYCSFMVPLAESLRLPALFVWSRNGLNSPREFVAQITPKKILHAPTSRHIVDDADSGDIERAVIALCQQIGHPPALPRQDGSDRRERPGVPR